ncbi:uncharacterized protein MYCFIDRAFT_176192 [Pseudocercospora fijiensis CIRAD86]|uniref:Uncharacterized protein n=1 Tax=Pseudocercospora fijiensis (strain CIRAD86) TaxID=383855 RepID=M3A882_PSEFD|nr:uncharacterized protein MYCFIDRAFT_176192 [Pseudocercospora fijiensis CIRAD86]EME80811.1 hypothetical protein MYCFIDRAFT_176192 [Pseudocercospora fijiensis CIRAD86]
MVLISTGSLRAIDEHKQIRKHRIDVVDGGRLINEGKPYLEPSTEEWYQYGRLETFPVVGSAFLASSSQTGQCYDPCTLDFMAGFKEAGTNHDCKSIMRQRLNASDLCAKALGRIVPAILERPLVTLGGGEVQAEVGIIID